MAGPGFFRYQKPMLQVVAATTPATLGAVYFFGWRALFVVGLSVAGAVAVEWLFCRARKEPVSMAVFVSAVLYALTLPPTAPWHVILVGIGVGIMFGKEVFGGFGRNVFNPALVGRCFVYVCFPAAMTGEWSAPFSGFPGGFAAWSAPLVDGLTKATPLHLAKTAAESLPGYGPLLFGNVQGCLGETSFLLVALGGAFLLWKKTANWRIVAGCLLGALATSAGFHYLGSPSVPDPLFTVLAGGFLFAAVFMATDPVSAARTDPGRWLYGLGIGALTVIIRGFSNFTGGVMFAILLMNMFNPMLDHYLKAWSQWRQAAKKPESPAATS